MSVLLNNLGSQTLALEFQLLADKSQKEILEYLLENEDFQQSLFQLNKILKKQNLTLEDYIMEIIPIPVVAKYLSEKLENCASDISAILDNDDYTTEHLVEIIEETGEYCMDNEYQTLNELQSILSYA